MQTAVSNETFLATEQEFFFTKIAPIESITDIVLLSFWLMLLSWMFISSYTAIYFFVKGFIFFECLYFSEYDIRMSRYIQNIWLRKGPLIKYVRNWFGDGRGSSKMHTAAYRGKGASHIMCAYPLTTSLFMFWQHFCLIVSCYIKI